MLLGENGAGRRDLVRALLPALSHAPGGVRPSLAVEYVGPFVLPPSEFLENRRFYRACITTSLECATLVFVQNAVRKTSVFPPGFATIFNRRVLGVITNAHAPGAYSERARRFLQSAGVREIHELPSLHGPENDGKEVQAHALEALRAALELDVAHHHPASTP